MPGSFIDTNVLVYLALDEGAKSKRAQQLVGAGAMISVQVLNEITNVARRKRTRSWQEVRDLLATLRGLLEVVPATLLTHELSLDVAERYELATFDALLVAAALIADCDSFWSEDMHHGLVIADRLTIRNPFLPA